MTGISLSPRKNKEIIEPKVGTAGITLAGKNRQYTEARFGFKGLALQAKQGGMAQMVVTYRYTAG